MILDLFRIIIWLLLITVFIAVPTTVGAVMGYEANSYWIGSLTGALVVASMFIFLDLIGPKE